MELVNSKNKTICFIKNNIDLYDIFIIFLSVCVTFIHDAFMFNPLLIALFYLSYKKGWLVTLFTYSLSLLVSFLKNIECGCLHMIIHF